VITCIQPNENPDIDQVDQHTVGRGPIHRLGAQLASQFRVRDRSALLQQQ